MINKKIFEKMKIKLFLKSAVVVAQQLSTRLMTERSWVRILQGAGLFSLLYRISSAFLIQVPHGGATLLIFI